MNEWIYTVIFIGVILCFGLYIIFVGKVEEWLKWAVTEAEKYLKSGTGQLKLRKVYDMLITQFPVFSKILPFWLFSNLVDNALKWLDEQLEKNPNIAKYVRGE